MKKETIKNILNFLEKEENKKHKGRDNVIWKLKFDEPFTEEELNVKGNLDLSYSKITSLPDGLKVGGYLILNYSSIKSLPDSLKVGGRLNLVYTKITSLPKGLEVEGDLFIVRTNFTNFSNDEIRDMIKPGFIRGKIYRL